MNEFEDLECLTFCKKYRLHFENANFAKGLIPRKVLLDNTRNIHSYFVFCKYDNDSLSSAYWQKENLLNSIKLMISLQFSDLDRPLFLVFRTKNNQYNTIEGNELREALLEKPCMDIVKYIRDNSYSFNDVLFQIRKELIIKS